MLEFITGIWNAVQPYRTWIILGTVAVLTVIVAIIVTVRAILLRRHDRALAREAEAEATREAPSALDAEVSVIPPEALPQDENRIFMPVPGKVSDLVDFVRENRDGVLIRSCVPAEEADKLLTDAQAVDLRHVVYREGVVTDDVAYVSVDVLSANFLPYSYVNLEILKKHGFVEESMTALSVRADGVLRKPLLIEANEFSLPAVKMISLVGGRALEVRNAKRGQ